MDDVDRHYKFADYLYQRQNGYASVGGIFKSTDGGVNWNQISPTSIMNATQYAGFVEKLTMDPTNHLHLLASFSSYHMRGQRAPGRDSSSAQSAVPSPCSIACEHLDWLRSQ